MDWVLRQREKENEWNPQYCDPCPRRAKSGHSSSETQINFSQSPITRCWSSLNTLHPTGASVNPIFNVDTPAVPPLWVSATLYLHCTSISTSLCFHCTSTTLYDHSGCRPNCLESECSERAPHPPSKLKMDTQWICVYSAVVSILLWLTGETNIPQCADAPLKAQYGPWQLCVCVHSSVSPIFLGVDWAHTFKPPYGFVFIQVSC